ncbi:hypothetical protein HPB47_004884, partial [Ixodes persulcatus]
NPGLDPACLSQLTVQYPCVTAGRNVTCNALPPLNSARVESCTRLQTFDYFSESEVSYALTFLGLALFVLVWLISQLLDSGKPVRCIRLMREIVCFQKVGDASRKVRSCHGIMIYRASNIYTIPPSKPAALYVYIAQVDRPQKKILIFSVQDSKSSSMQRAREWQGPKPGYRNVAIRFLPDKKFVNVVHATSGASLRSIDLRKVQSVVVQVASAKNRFFFMLRLPREYDLVLKFDSKEDLEGFIGKLEEFLGAIGVGRERRELEEHTASSRGGHAGAPPEAAGQVLPGRILELDAAQARDVVNLELTQSEFASALSMQPDSTFVQQMFELVDNDNNGYISFREFLDMIVIFSKGTAEDKTKLMFDMYDIDHSGKLSRDEFANMIKSLLELANQSLSQEKLNELIASMFHEAGLQNKMTITLDDFQELLKSHKEQLGYTQLNFDVASFRGPSPASLNRNSVVYRAQNTLVRAYRVRAEPLAVQRKVNYDQDTASRYLVALEKFVENHRLDIFWLVLYTLVLLAIFSERAYYYSVEREHGGLRQIAGYGVTITRGAASAQMFTYSTLLLTMCRNSITFLRDTFLHRYVPFDSAIPMHLYVAIWAGIFSVIHSVGHAFNFYHIATQTADDLTCLFREYFHATDELPKFHYWCFATMTGLTGVFLLMLLAVMYVFATPYARRHVFNAFWNTHNLYPVFYILMILHGLGRLVQPPIFYYFLLGPLVLYVLDRLVSLSRKKVEISVIRAEHLPSDVTMLLMKRPSSFEYRSGQWVRIACLGLNGSEYHPFTLSSAPHEDNLSVHVRALGPWTINLRTIYDPSNLPDSPYPKIYLDGPYGGGHQDWFRFEVSVLVGGGIGVTPFASILKDIAYRASSKARVSCKKVYFIWVSRFGVFSCGPFPMTRSVESACEHLNRKEGAIFDHHYENF